MIIGKVRNKLKNCIKNYKKRYEKSLVRVYKAIPTMKMGNNYGGFAVSAAFVLSNANNNIHTMGGGVIYSFGIGADLSFSQSILDACNCEVYAFDPTPKAISYVLNHPLYHNPRFHFYPIGLGSKDEIADFYLPKIDVHTPDHVEISGSTRWRDELDSVSIKVKIKCLSSIMKELGHTKIDVLKLDIKARSFLQWIISFKRE